MILHVWYMFAKLNLKTSSFKEFDHMLIKNKELGLMSYYCDLRK